MTTITGTGAYSTPPLPTQTTNRQTNTAANNTDGTANNSATGTSTTGSTSTLADAIKAAADSGSYTFAMVAQNAKTVLDAGVQAYGQTPGSQTTNQDWIKIFGGMDRRSLYAVASNQGGQFSSTEQTAAKTLMDNQLANVANVSSTSSTSEQIAGYTAQANYLNNASPEEKQSASWAYSMADAQSAARMADIDSRMPQASSNSPLVNTLMGAMYNVRSQISSPISFGSVNSLSDITSQPWAKSYSSQIESAFAATYQPGGSYSATV
jgi:hypothetical protein